MEDKGLTASFWRGGMGARPGRFSDSPRKIGEGGGDHAEGRSFGGLANVQTRILTYYLSTEDLRRDT